MLNAQDNKRIRSTIHNKNSEEDLGDFLPDLMDARGQI